MRITHGMLQRSALADLNASATRLTTVQQQLSSGLQRTKASDDVVGAARSLRLTSSLEGIGQLQKNVSDATAFADASETALSGLNDIIARARVLVVQGGNDGTDQSSRDAIAKEIDQLAEAAKDQVNVSLGGRYVFSGTATNTPAYAAGSDTYQGDAGTIGREIGVGVSVTVNQNAGDLLGSGGGDGKLLAVLRTIATDLRAGNTAALRSTGLTTLDGASEGVIAARAANGSLTSRLEATTSQLLAFEEQTTRALAQVDAVDYGKASIEYATGAAAYQAALKAGANIVQSSLMDFLN